MYCLHDCLQNVNRMGSRESNTTEMIDFVRHKRSTKKKTRIENVRPKKKQKNDMPT